MAQAKDVHDTRPKPIELKRRLGDPGKHLPAGVNESAQIGDEIVPIEPPDDLPPEGADLWREVLPTLAKYGGLRSIDLPALKAMCIAWARAQRASAVLDKQGYFTTGSTGQMVAHPAMKVEQEYMSVFLRYATEFGLTWIARSRLGLNEATRQAILSGMDKNLGANPRG